MAGIALLALGAGLAPAMPPTSPAARAALQLCHEAESVEATERDWLWSQGVVLAEHALQRNPDDPVAHFGVFCNLGKRAATTGLRPSTLALAPRLRFHIEQALALAPDWPEALAARGAFLASLPAILGGDVAEGERLLRRALALDPANALTRRELARLLREQGRDAEAEAVLAPTN